METLQTLLNYAAITPFIIAVGMFLEYTWRRSTPRPVQAVVEPAQHAQELNSEPRVHVYQPVEVAESIQAIPDQSDIEEELTAAPVMTVMTLQPSPAAEPTATKVEPMMEPAPKRKRGRPRKNPIVAIAV